MFQLRILDWIKLCNLIGMQYHMQMETLRQREDVTWARSLIESMESENLGI